MRAVCYCRVASPPQSMDFSALDEQEHALRAYCESKGYVITEVIREVGSGMDIYRNGLARVKMLMWSGQVDVVVVIRPDRLSRSAIELFTFFGLAQAYIVSVETPYGRIQVPDDTRRAIDRVILDLELSIRK